MKAFFSKGHLASHLLRQRLRASLSSSSWFRAYSGSCNNKKDRPDPHSSLLAKSFRPSSWIGIILPTTALVAIAGAFMLVRYNDERRAIPKGSEKEVGQKKGPVNKQAFGGPFRLISADYGLVTESDLRGHWSLLYFGYTSSPDVGPEEVQKMAKAIDLLESKYNTMVKGVFISIDPQRDNPTHLRAYLREFDSRILGLSGPVDAIRQIAREYRIFFKKIEEEGGDYLVEASNSMYLLDPSLEIVKCFTVVYDATQLCEDILEEMRRPFHQDKKNDLRDKLHTRVESSPGTTV